MMTNPIQRAADVRLLAAILDNLKSQGRKSVSRTQLGVMIDVISPRLPVGPKQQKMGITFSDMIQDAASLVPGAQFKFETHASGRRKRVRVEF
jgi:hypothetical protein